jgi:hypothetical protein
MSSAIQVSSIGMNSSTPDPTSAGDHSVAAKTTNVSKAVARNSPSKCQSFNVRMSVMVRKTMNSPWIGTYEIVSEESGKFTLRSKTNPDKVRRNVRRSQMITRAR